MSDKDSVLGSIYIYMVWRLNDMVSWVSGMILRLSDKDIWLGAMDQRIHDMVSWLGGML